MAQLVFRFLIGGLIASLFAALGDVLIPKSFAGLFDTAPSVGLATLSLTVLAEWYAAPASIATLLLWFVLSSGLWLLLPK